MSLTKNRIPKVDHQLSASEVREKLLALTASSYPAMFRQRVAETPTRVAYLSPPQTDGQAWEQVTWRQVRKIADQAAAGFIALGLQPEQRVAIAASTRIEWIYADLGIACAGGATTTVYPNTRAEEVLLIISDSNSVMAVVEDATQLRKFASLPQLRDQLGHIVILVDDRSDEDLHSDKVLTWQQLLMLGRDYLASHPRCVDDVIATLGPDTLATIIYTSGTTGRPKGVELLHRNWTYEGVALDYMDIVLPDDLLYLWLPMSHVFGRDLLTLSMKIGLTSAVDGRVPNIVDNLSQLHPTILVGVPRIFEKVRAAVLTKYPSSGIRGRIARWAFAVGRQSRSYRLAGEPLPLRLRVAYAVADKLVFAQLKERLGGRMRFMISGSAKLSRQVQEWFYSAGITIIEGYGMTETAAVTFLNKPDRPRFGTVGPVIPGLEVRLDDDGEVLVKGPTVARGYHNLPEETANAFVDGWYRTGDIGVLDDDGYLTITDRKKDLFKTSNGKYVAPQKVENTLMANIPYIGQAVVVGDGRKFISALVTMEPASLERWGQRHGHAGRSYAELSQLPEIRESIDRFMRRVNGRLERWEQIKQYRILDRELTLERGELTPSLKVRRTVVLTHFADLIDEIYSDDQQLSDLTAN